MSHFFRLRRSKRRKGGAEEVEEQPVVSTSNIDEAMVSEIDSSVITPGEGAAVVNGTSSLSMTEVAVKAAAEIQAAEIKVSSLPEVKVSLTEVAVKAAVEIQAAELKASKEERKRRKKEKKAKKERKRQNASMSTGGLLPGQGVVLAHRPPPDTEKPLFRKSNITPQEQSEQVSSSSRQYRRHNDGEMENEEEGTEAVEEKEKEEFSEGEEELIRMRNEIREKLASLQSERQNLQTEVEEAKAHLSEEEEITTESAIAAAVQAKVVVDGSDEGEIVSDDEIKDDDHEDLRPPGMDDDIINELINESENVDTVVIRESELEGAKVDVFDDNIMKSEINKEVTDREQKPDNDDHMQVDDGDAGNDGDIEDDGDVEDRVLDKTFVDQENAGKGGDIIDYQPNDKAVDISDNEGVVEDDRGDVLEPDTHLDEDDEDEGEIKDEDSDNDSVDEFGRAKNIRARMRKHSSDEEYHQKRRRFSSGNSDNDRYERNHFPDDDSRSPVYDSQSPVYDRNYTAGYRLQPVSPVSESQHHGKHQTKSPRDLSKTDSQRGRSPLTNDKIKNAEKQDDSNQSPRSDDSRSESKTEKEPEEILNLDSRQPISINLNVSSKIQGKPGSWPPSPNPNTLTTKQKPKSSAGTPKASPAGGSSAVIAKYFENFGKNGESDATLVTDADSEKQPDITVEDTKPAKSKEKKMYLPHSDTSESENEDVVETSDTTTKVDDANNETNEINESKPDVENESDKNNSSLSAEDEESNDVPDTQNSEAKSEKKEVELKKSVSEVALQMYNRMSALVDMATDDETNEKEKSKDSTEAISEAEDDKQKEDDALDIFAPSDKEGDGWSDQEEAGPQKDSSSSSDTDLDDVTDSEDDKKTENSKKEEGLQVQEMEERPPVKDSEAKQSEEFPIGKDSEMDDEARKDQQDFERREQERREAKKKEEEEYRKTLDKLQNLRNKVDVMSVDELEAALKDLPSFDELQKQNQEDGRKTPPHLRNIEVPVKSLAEYVYDKKILYKQLFKVMNKKEFKSKLPKSLLVCMIVL